MPAMVRWPGHIQPGSVSNEMFSGLDWFPTLLAAAGDTTIKERLLKGAKIGERDFQGSPGRLQPTALPTGNSRRALATSSPTSTTTALWSRSGTVTGRQSSAREDTRRFWRLAGTLHLPARSETVQSAHGSLRTRRYRFRSVQRLAGQEAYLMGYMS